MPVTGVSSGATTIVASSARGNAWAIASVSPAVSRTMGVDAPPVGIVVVPARSLGRVLTPINGQTTLVVPILARAAVVSTPVDVTSSNPAVAFVTGVVTIAEGSRTAGVVISTGVTGTATLTLRAGNEITQLTIVVGNPADGMVPPTVAQRRGAGNEVAVQAATAALKGLSIPGIGKVDLEPNWRCFGIERSDEAQDPAMT